MANLDPIFADAPRPFVYPEATPVERNTMQMANAVFGALSKPAYQREADWLREDIASLGDDIAYCERRIAELKKEIPSLQRELLEQQRDLAEHKLTRYEKQAELATKTGGAA